MTLPDLGHAVVINNLATQLPEMVPVVETLESTLETIGFKVKSYKDFNVQVKTLLRMVKLLHSRNRIKT